MPPLPRPGLPGEDRLLVPEEIADYSTTISGYCYGPFGRKTRLDSRPATVELLATAGFDVNALSRSDIPSNQPWHTALHVAAENGNLALARRLLQLGADPNIPDKHYQSTPLEWARHSGQPTLAELLEPLTQQT